MQPDYILWLERAKLGDIPIVGGKNASLGELVGSLAQHGITVPAGFATTVAAYRAFIGQNALAPLLQEAITKWKRSEQSLAETGLAIRNAILASALPPAVSAAISTAYEALGERLGQSDPSVAVRSSATAEDLPTASFAGQQETYLNVAGSTALIDACRRCYASLYTDRAISYRDANGIDQLSVAVSVGVQQMVNAANGSSGVIFSIDTETGFPGAIVATASWGLGETIVQGIVDPDKYVVFKPLLGTTDKLPIVERTLGSKQRKLVYAHSGVSGTAIVPTSFEEQAAFVLSNAEVIRLAEWVNAIERHYRVAMDIEWAKDGPSGKLYILQARPETVQSARAQGLIRTYSLEKSGTPIIAGAAVGEAIAVGPVSIIRSPDQMAQFRDGSILVAETTDPDWVPVMRRAAGIITDHGGATSHAAIVSRELGVPAIVGTGSATRVLADDQVVTISCAEGEQGVVYDGALPFTVEDVSVDDLPTTRTALMVNSADPGRAFHWWRLPAKGVGLARMEFIISNLIKVHPMAIAHPERVDAATNRQIADLARGYATPREFFVETLAMGVAKLATPFHPHPAIVRLSDFKTNEYAGLLGGSAFESTEENPMLGFRGASRYYSDRYRDGFALECQALKRAREQLGFTNIIVMVPFCRTLAEADRVLEAMIRNGLRRGVNGLEIYMMCEIPSNVVLAEQFATRFDGFSIGSNDLTQLTLGVDRDSADLADLFDERDEAVRILIRNAIAAAHHAGIKIGICGQAPSNYPEFASFLVGEGIDSISLNPDSFVRTAKLLGEVEAADVANRRSSPVHAH